MDKKALSFPLLISLVVGNMIGTGIYVLPASLANFGTISILSWIFTSAGALFLALTFAQLNKRFPKTGGPYVYCKEAFGQFTGFLVGYLYWISNMVSIAGIAVSSVGYLGFLFPTFDSASPSYNLATIVYTEIAIVWLFTIVNMIGIHTAGVVQLCLTIIKVLPLLFIILIGFRYVNLTNLSLFTLSNQTNYFSTISAAAALTFWAFIGLEAATIPAENTSGSRDIFKATVYGTLIVALIYILCTFVLMGMVPVTQLKDSAFPFAEATTLLFGHHAALLIVFCAVLSGLGALNCCILVQGQIIFAAARDRLLPKKFAVLSKKDVPIWGQLLSSLLVTVFLIITMQPTLLEQFDQIALLAALLTLLTYLITMIAEIKFNFLKNSFQSAIFSKTLLFALLAVLYSVWMISSLDKVTLFLGFGMVLFFIPIYFVQLKINKNKSL